VRDVLAAAAGVPAGLRRRERRPGSGCRDVCGKEPDDAGVAYWMDAAIFADAGADTVNYGPTGAAPTPERNGWIWTPSAAAPACWSGRRDATAPDGCAAAAADTFG
jgi:hypothetical protein